VYDGSRSLGTVRVDQNALQADFTDGADWQILNTYTIVGNTLTVKLTDSAKGTVFADAVRIERVESLMVDAAVAVSRSAAVLTKSQLAPLADEAIRRLTNSSAGAETAALAGVEFEIVDLPGNVLAETVGRTVRIDRDAAGYGWFIDPTPWADEEFLAGRVADESAGAVRVDLLTAVMHELGHVLGYGHSAGLDTMHATLPLGVRRS